MNRQQQDINNTALLAGIIGQVGCITVILIAVALGAGIIVDNLLDTRPVFTILFMVGSVPVTLYVIVRVTLSAAARSRASAAAEDENKETDA